VNKWQHDGNAAPARWERNFSDSRGVVHSSIHPINHVSKHVRAARARERYENASPSKRVGMFCPR
jgi:hypothetical protein